jgi:hypothetical protein
LLHLEREVLEHLLQALEALLQFEDLLGQLVFVRLRPRGQRHRDQHGQQHDTKTLHRRFVLLHKIYLCALVYS